MPNETTVLKYYRKRCNLTQTELAARVNKAQAEISMYEHRVNYVPERIADLLIEVFRTELGDKAVEGLTPVDLNLAWSPKFSKELSGIRANR